MTARAEIRQEMIDRFSSDSVALILENIIRGFQSDKVCGPREKYDFGVNK